MKDWFSYFLKIVFIILSSLAIGSLGYFYGGKILPYSPLVSSIIGLAAGLLLGVILHLLLVRLAYKVIPYLDLIATKFSIPDFLISFGGALSGYFISLLLLPLFNLLPVIGSIISATVTIILSVTGAYLAYRKKEEFKLLLASVRGDKKPQVRYFVVDTSSIIDGRLAEFIQTGIIEGTLIIPGVVLSELHKIADSTEPLKRTRGRRGLEVLASIKEEKAVTIEVVETKKASLTVDEVIIDIARKVNGMIISNDYNLTRIARLRGIKVCNLSELSYALRMQVLPGEEITIAVIREGKEQHQGVGYLDDGTMVVVEEGKNYVGQTIDIVVSSVLQTPSGKLIFGRHK